MNENAADALARGWLDFAESYPDRFPVNRIDSADDAIRHAKQLSRQAALSRSTGWTPSSEWQPLSAAFVEEVECVFEQHGVPWSDEPLIAICP
jgi:hypothetical protein